MEKLRQSGLAAGRSSFLAHSVLRPGAGDREAGWPLLARRLRGSVGERLVRVARTRAPRSRRFPVRQRKVARRARLWGFRLRRRLGRQLVQGTGAGTWLKTGIEAAVSNTAKKRPPTTKPRLEPGAAIRGPASPWHPGFACKGAVILKQPVEHQSAPGA